MNQWKASVRARLTNSVMFSVCALFTVLIVGLLILVMGYLVSKGAGSFSIAFFTELPTGDLRNPGGMKHAVLGTLMLLAMASLIGVPVAGPT